MKSFHLRRLQDKKTKRKPDFCQLNPKREQKMREFSYSGPVTVTRIDFNRAAGRSVVVVLLAKYKKSSSRKKTFNKRPI